MGKWTIILFKRPIETSGRGDKKLDSKIITICGIASVTILEIVALCNGIDGALLTTAIAVIAGMAGYEIKNMRR